MTNIGRLARLVTMTLVILAPIAGEASPCNAPTRLRCHTQCVETPAVVHPRRTSCRRQWIETPTYDVVAWRERPYRRGCASRSALVVPETQYVDVAPTIEYVAPRLRYVVPRVEYVAPPVEYVAAPQEVIYYAAPARMAPAVAPYPSCAGCPVYVNYDWGPGGLPGFLGVDFSGW
jgi:hypothetical protein